MRNAKYKEEETQVRASIYPYHRIRKETSDVMNRTSVAYSAEPLLPLTFDPKKKITFDHFS